MYKKFSFFAYTANWFELEHGLGEEPSAQAAAGRVQPSRTLPAPPQPSGAVAGNEGRCQDLSKEVNASATTEADCGTVRPPSSSAVSKRTRSKTKKQSPRLAVNKARSRFACYGGGSRSRLSRELVSSDMGPHENVMSRLL